LDEEVEEVEEEEEDEEKEGNDCSSGRSGSDSMAKLRLVELTGKLRLAKRFASSAMRTGTKRE
jgi:hypothetical protein